MILKLDLDDILTLGTLYSLYVAEHPESESSPSFHELAKLIQVAQDVLRSDTVEVVELDLQDNQAEALLAISAREFEDPPPDEDPIVKEEADKIVEITQKLRAVALLQTSGPAITVWNTGKMADA